MAQNSQNQRIGCCDVAVVILVGCFGGGLLGLILGQVAFPVLIALISFLSQGNVTDSATAAGWQIFVSVGSVLGGGLMLTACYVKHLNAQAPLPVALRKQD